ncbi:MAG: PQQ-like beta-propeller repeat protein [Hyphomonadaceae bacterium]|nr:PQQ-like beta-propeller repeat protein [Hyphomonadaceae bacterium]
MSFLRPMRLFALFLAGTLALTGCSNFLMFGGADREAEEAADRAGRIAMVLGDETLQADPELATRSIILPAAETLDVWTEAGSRPSKVVGHVLAGSALNVAWRRDAGEGSSRSAALTTAPVANANHIYVLDAGQTVRAFDLQTGSPTWRHEIDSGSRRDRIGIGGGLALTGDTLVVSSGFGMVLALDAETGSLLWTRETEAPMTGSPTIKDGRIFVTSNNNEILALSLEDGELEWSDQAISESARVLSSPSPAAVEDIVVVPYSSGEVIAYLASNGRRLWSDALSRPGRFTPISAINDIASRPVLAGGLVVVANQSGVTAAIDGRSGTRIWAQAIGSTQAPALAGEYVFIAGTDATLAALEATTGRVYWATQMAKYRDEEDEKGRLSYSGPIIASGRVVVVSSEGDMIAYDPQTGLAVDRIDLGGKVYLEPIAVGETLYVLTDNARLIAIR